MSIRCKACGSEYTDIKLDDCDKHVQTDFKNDHSTSKVLGHVTTHSINLISTSVHLFKQLGVEGLGTKPPFSSKIMPPTQMPLLLFNACRL